MNVLKLDIRPKLNNHSEALWLILSIDDEVFLKRIDENLNAAIWPELERSLKGSGDYLIFSCECGVADCGGWGYVKVKHTLDNIIWKFSYEEKNYLHQFDKGQYIGEVERLRRVIKQEQLNLEPGFIVDPE